MGLTKRQAALINQIISEDAQGVIAGRNARDGHLHRGKLLEEQLDELVDLTPHGGSRSDRGGHERSAVAQDFKKLKKRSSSGDKEASSVMRYVTKNAGAPKSAARYADLADHVDELDEAEYGPKGIDPKAMEGRVNVDLLEKQIQDAFEDQMISGFDAAAWSLCQLIHKGVVKELFASTKKYGLGYTTPREVASLLDPVESENDDVSDAEMEFHGALLDAATEYGKAMARSLMKVVDRTNEDYEG